MCVFRCQESKPILGEVGLWTSEQSLCEQATQVIEGAAPGERHVLLPVCTQHIVEIYRGVIPGVRMAWNSLRESPPRLPK